MQTLPNLIYTDGNAFSLWRNGELESTIIALDGNIETAGARLTAPPGLPGLFADFFQWQPQPPKSAPALAELTARLCRLLREEVTEQLARGSGPLTNLATDWRKLLFPSATNEAFADGYAQAVTFGLLMARARRIPLGGGLDRVAGELRQTNTLIGTALRLLTDDAENQKTLKTSLATLTRVLDAVHWDAISKGDPETWLYFYETFLTTYDSDLRRKTGSYYTPPEVVLSMVRLVDEALKSAAYFGLTQGLASPEVTVADPATGTGTYLLGVLRRIAETTAADQGPGAVPGVIEAAIPRLIGFELQLGPFAVAQLRLLAELQELVGDAFAGKSEPLRLFVTDTLGNPFVEDEYIPHILMPLGESRRQANRIKRQERITVVIGNPPYKDKAKGLGGWVESGSANRPGQPVPLLDWMPPPEWNVGAHAKHLRNLYVYFWRLGRLEGVRRRRPRRHPGPRAQPDGHCLLHHRGGFSERPRLPEDARRPAGRGGRNLGDRLLAGRPPAAHSQPHLSGRPAAGVHRHGAAKKPHGGVPTRTGSLPHPGRQDARGQVRRVQRHFPGRRRLGGVPGRAACAVPAQGVRRLGRFCASGGHFRL